MSIKGLDVSEFQGEIDWERVKAAGYQFAMLRAGYGYSTAATRLNATASVFPSEHTGSAMHFPQKKPFRRQTDVSALFQNTGWITRCAMISSRHPQIMSKNRVFPSLPPSQEM